MIVLTTNNKHAINYHAILSMVFTCSLVLFAAALCAQNVTTFAGTAGVPGLVNGYKDSCQFNGIEQMAFDSHGNLFIADYNNNVIRKIDTTGIVSTFAGTGAYGFANGQKDTCQFKNPIGIAIDKFDNIYISEGGYYGDIRKIDAAGIVTTFAGAGTFGYTNGPASIAQFVLPAYMCFDDSLNLYVADSFNDAIRRVDSLGNVTTFAGAGAPGWADGVGENAYFSNPIAITFNKKLGAFFVTDRGFSFIRKITLAREVTTIAGTGLTGYNNGPGNTAIFYGPKGITTDSIGNIYIGGRLDRTIRKIDLQNQVSTLAGVPLTSGYQDGPAATALFSRPISLVFNKNNELLISDFDNYVIRKIGSINDLIFVPQLKSDLLFSVYPNPASDYIQIVGLPLNSTYSIDILNVMGQTMLSQKFTNSRSLNLTISLLPAGIYSIFVNSEGKGGVSRFVKC